MGMVFVNIPTEMIPGGIIQRRSVFFLRLPFRIRQLSGFIQMEELGEIAELIGRKSDSLLWKERAERMLGKMLEKLFRDNRPLAIQTVTGK